MATNMTSQSVLSMPVQQAAAAQQLGAFIKSYKVNIVTILLGNVVIVAMGIFFAFIALQPANDQSSMAIELIAALLFFGASAYSFFRFMQIAGRLIHLFQAGLIIEHKGQVQPFPWSQAAEVYQSITRRYRNGIYMGTTYKYTLRRTDGYQIKLDNSTKGIAELGQAVSKAVTQELVPRAIHAVQSGQTLTFGQFTINQQGIGNGREFIPWPQVQAVNVRKGRLSVEKAGKFLSWGSAMVANIPNFFVFLAVAEEMIRRTKLRQ